jgi:energy-coupling factor transporter ATP-binding protein EcfA2
MDFYRILQRELKDGGIEIYPDFKVVRSKDLMISGKKFYAIWDTEVELWSTDEYDVQRLVDQDLDEYKIKLAKTFAGKIKVRHMGNFSSKIWREFRSYVTLLSDSFHQLDGDLTFANDKVKKTDYRSKRLPYPLEEGDHSAWDDLVSVLYDPEQRAKIEWAIGAIIAGDAKTIQKFLVFYGDSGTGKSTILQIIEWLFPGYYKTFDAKALGSSNSTFAMDVFKTNPLVVIQHDGDLSKIEDNTKLNSITSHEMMRVEEKFMPSYDSHVNAFAFMGTNKPVKITDSKSGIPRRLIDVRPTGDLIPPRTYQTLMAQMEFQLGAIAQHCLTVYLSMGKKYYDDYRATDMMLQTNVFYNFIEAHYDVFEEQDGATLNQAFQMWKKWTQDTDVEWKMPQYKFRDEFSTFWYNFEERAVVNGVRVRSWYSGFKTKKLAVQQELEKPFTLVLEHDRDSLFDRLFADCPAQYATSSGTPRLYWTNEPRIINGELKEPNADQVVSTILSQINTNKEHYVRVPETHIVIDFDLRDETGEKSAELNLEEASKWPLTYAEYSKSGGGIHLHYDYVGDVSQLSAIYSEGIEVKVFTGKTSLRRKFSFSNNVPVAKISSGLPLKEKKKMLTVDQIKSEEALRALIEKNLRKEIHSGTKSSVDFIAKILDDAYASDLKYDVTDMRARIIAFANNSTNQNLQALKVVQKMQFASENNGELIGTPADELTESSFAVGPGLSRDDRVVLFDVEVFSNLFVVCWKYEGSKETVRMINPTPTEIEQLLTMKLVGFFNRNYDNHILYARLMGYTNEQLFKLSQKLISNVVGVKFGAAYDLSYADIYDFSSIKWSLKKFEIELRIPHKELGLDWNEPVPEELWDKVVDYCVNDVEATDAVFQDRRQDFVARQILADLSGLPVNASTAQHAARIIFEGDRNPQQHFIYTELEKEFPGYTYEAGKSSYRDEITGEGGYVYAEPGIYHNVALLDIASMHPTTINVLDLFGHYTPNFWGIVQARLAIKREDYETARSLLDGKLAKHLSTTDEAKALSDALKIIINIVYGLTSAKFDNPFKDPRNKDNIVAKRGALFMIELKHAVQDQGYTVIHIKTDSIKIANADKAIIEFVMEFGDAYGYTFEHEATYEKIALVNNAVYIAKTMPGRKPAYWEAVGAEFQQPYVYKTLFSKEEIEFHDLCEPKYVTGGAIFLDFTDMHDVPMALSEKQEHFVGKAGLFTPVKDGATLVRRKDDKDFAVTGTKGYRWLESDMVENLQKYDDIDMDYFHKMVDDAKDKIAKYGDVEAFLD